MSKRRRYSRQQQPARNQQQQPRTQGALALADNGSTPANPANVVRTFTPAPMAGNAQYNAQGNQQWGPSSNTAGEAPNNQYYPNMPEVKDDKPLLSNIGATGTAIFSGVVTNEEYNPDFYWKDGIRIFEQMLRNDGQVNAVREIVEQPILRAEKHIVPGSSSARDKEIASFIETCLFEDMRYTSTDGIEEVQTWDSLLRHILMHLWYGFMVFEQVWRIEDGWVKWARWTPLLPRTVWRWWVGDDNALTGIQQWTFREHNYQFVDIPAKKLVRFHRRLEGQNYEGVSVLRSAYKHWFYKIQFEKIEAIGAERNAVVPAVIKLPEGFTQGDYTNAQTIVANIRANSQMGVTIPGTWDIEYMRNFQRQAVQMQDSIQYHDVMIARNSLAQFINLGSTETGAYSLDDSQRKDFLNNLQSICCAIEDTINNGPIRQLVDYNYENVEVYPKLQFGKVLMSDLSSLADAISKLVTAGLIHPDPQMEDYLREAGGLPGAPESVVNAYNPTAPTTPSRPGNENASSHDTQNPTQPMPNGTANANSTGPDDAGSSGGGDTGGDGGGSLSEVRLLAEALRATVQAIDPVERGLSFRLYAPDQARDSHGRFEDEGAPSKQSGGTGRGRGGRSGGASAKSSQTSKGEHTATAKSGGGRGTGKHVSDEQFHKAVLEAHKMHVDSTGHSEISKVRSEVMKRTGVSKQEFETRLNHMRDSAQSGKPGLHLHYEENEELIGKRSYESRGIAYRKPANEQTFHYLSIATGKHDAEGIIHAEPKHIGVGEHARPAGSATKTTRAPRATKAAKSEEEKTAAKAARGDKAKGARLEAARQRMQDAEHEVNRATEALHNAHGSTFNGALAQHGIAREELMAAQKAAARLEGVHLHPGEPGFTREEFLNGKAVYQNKSGIHTVSPEEAHAWLNGGNKAPFKEPGKASTSKSSKGETVSRAEHAKVQAELARVKAENEALKAGQKAAAKAGKGEQTTTAKSGAAKIQAIRTDLPMRSGGPGRTPSPHYLRALYGDHQLESALGRYSKADLGGAAQLVGAKPGRSNKDTIGRIITAVQKVPYDESVRRVRSGEDVKAPGE